MEVLRLVGLVKLLRRMLLLGADEICWSTIYVLGGKGISMEFWVAFISWLLDLIAILGRIL